MSDPWVTLSICLAGGVGAGLRVVVDAAIRSATSGRYPVATTVINLSGSLMLGLLTGLWTDQLLPQGSHLVLGAGLLGGYTTFSTASVETVELFEECRYRAAALYGFGTLIAATLAAGLGFWIGLAAA